MNLNLQCNLFNHFEKCTLRLTTIFLILKPRRGRETLLKQISFALVMKNEWFFRIRMDIIFKSQYNLLNHFDKDKDHVSYYLFLFWAYLRETSTASADFNCSG